MAPRKKVREEEIDSLIAAVHAEKVIWYELDDNHTNDYMLEKAWARVGKSLGCTVPAVQNKWAELGKERQQALLKIPHLTSGSAGGEQARQKFSAPLQELDFLKDKRVPVTETSGNVDVLVDEQDVVPVHVTPPLATKMTESNSQVRGGAAVPKQSPEEKFFQSLLPDVDKLSDREKLKYRIDVAHLYCMLHESSVQAEEEDLEIIGEFISERSVRMNRASIKKEDDNQI